MAKKEIKKDELFNTNESYELNPDTLEHIAGGQQGFTDRFDTYRYLDDEERKKLFNR